MSNANTESLVVSRAESASRGQADARSAVYDRVPFRWTRREQATLPVQVSGQLPAWLRGQLVRTAPAIFESQGWRAGHWFDGLGLVYGFAFREQVTFTQRALACEQARELAAGRARTATFDTSMRRNLLQRLLAPVPPVTDNANVNVVPWQGAWLAMTESPHQHVIDAGDLGSRGRYRYEDGLPKGLGMSAHPHFDFGQNAMINLGTTLGPKSELWVLRHDANGRTRKVEGKLAFKRVPYAHDFGLTPRHAVIIDHPFDVQPLSMLASNRGYIEHFRWRPERGTRLWKLERESGKWSDYQTEALFCFHTVNSFDDGADVVIDFLAYDDPAIVRALQTPQLERTGLPELRPRFVRARLSPGKRHAELTTLSEARFEFPSIAYRAQHGHPYTTVWGAAVREDARDGSGSEIVRVDLARDVVARFAEPGMTYGEPIFVPKPSAARADDGVLLTVGCDARSERSVVAVLDGTTLEPVAHCEVAVSLPLGFHGNFQGSHVTGA